jgi:nuclear pore complex protein Nup98-Nup96
VQLAHPASATAMSEKLEVHSKHRPIELIGNVPTTVPKPIRSIKTYFSGAGEDSAAGHEKDIWEVASILFDELPGGTQTTMAEEIQGRRAKLSAFWEELVAADCDWAIGTAQTNEEKAIVCLAGHRVSAACKYLIEGKDFRLASLVSLIGSNANSRADLQKQLESWKVSNTIAEMTDPIRALYGLLAGEVGFCAGKSKHEAPIEDQSSSFVISQRFGLNWKQAFGLRLWYGIDPDDDISEAVDMFQKDVEIHREPTPQPWYIQEGVSNSWPATNESQGEDELWSLLKLYASKHADISSVLAPRNLSLGPWDTRLAWQLSRALLDTGRFSLPSLRSDAMSLVFAEHLTGQGHWILAIWVLAHLSSASRGKAVQDQFARHAGQLVQNPAAWKELRTQPWVPLKWAYESLALWARSVEKDGVLELDFLRKAGDYREAHRALVTKVGPQAIIERDFDLLWMAEVLRKHLIEIPDWQLGGAIYAAYRQFRLSLQGGMGGKGHGGGVRVDVVEKLLGMLKDLKKQDVQMEVEQRAAVHLMTTQLKEVMQDCLKA